MSRVVYFNGEFVPESEARVSIYDSALMFGDVVFEMTRSFNGVHWRLEDHIERLYAGLKILRIDIGLNPQELKDIVHETTERNLQALDPTDEHRILINVTRGLLGLYDGLVDAPSGPNVLVADFPLRWTVNGCSRYFSHGVNLHLTRQQAIPARFLEPKIKNRNRIFYLMANMEVSLRAGEDNWALLTDEHGFIAEGSGTNFFMVKDGKIYTPRGQDILRGITRASIIEQIAPAANFEVIESDIEPYDIHIADEAFLASTPFCILPAVSLDSLPIGNGEVGPITKRLLETWSQIVGIDIVKQIERWDSEQTTIKKATPYVFKK